MYGKDIVKRSQEVREKYGLSLNSHSVLGKAFELEEYLSFEYSPRQYRFQCTYPEQEDAKRQKIQKELSILWDLGAYLSDKESGFFDCPKCGKMSARTVVDYDDVYKEDHVVCGACGYDEMTTKFRVL